MPGSLSNFMKNMYRTGTFRTGAFVKPAGLWVALYTAAPSDAGGGTEVVGGAYTRVQVGPSDATWSAHATDGRTQNVSVVTFPTPSANWGTVGWLGVHDASSAGNLLAWTPLSTARIVNLGDPGPTFGAGVLDFLFD